MCRAAVSPPLVVTARPGPGATATRRSLPRARWRRLWAGLGPATLAAAALVACSGHGGDDGPAPRTLQRLAGPAEAGGPGQRDGQGAAARLNRPLSVAATADGGAWLLDGDGSVLRRVQADGRVATVAAAPWLADVRDTTDASGLRVSFGGVRQLLAAPDGSVYLVGQRSTWQRVPASTPGGVESEVAVDNRWAVLRRDAAGLTTVAALDPAAGRVLQGSWAGAAALDSQGRLHVADTFACTVWRADGAAALAAVYRTPAAAQAARCRGLGDSGQAVTRLAFSPQGRLVVGLGDGSVWQVAAEGDATGAAQRLAVGAGLGLACNGMAWRADGRLVLAGVGNPSALYVVGDDGRPALWLGDPQQTGWADGDATNARWGHACALAAGPGGQLLVADTGQHTLRRVDAGGVVGTWLGLAWQTGWRDGPGEQALFGGDLALAVDGSRVLVADAANHALREVSASGQVRTLPGRGSDTPPVRPVDGPEPEARWAWPGPLAVAGDGRWWVADGQSLRLRQADGRVTSLVVDTLGGLRGVAAAPGGAVLLLADLLVGTPETPPARGSSIALVQRTHDGQQTLLADGRDPLIGQAEARGLLPQGLCRSGDGQLFISVGHAVLRRAPDGRVHLHAGDLGTRGAQDGPAAAARFDTPGGLACDDAGRVFVADTGNHAVRRVDVDGTVHTVLGRLGVQGLVEGAAPGGLDSPRQVVLVPDGLVVSSGLALVKARW